MNTCLMRLQNGDVSFIDDIIGTTEAGDNKSRYRAYLSKNGDYVIEIRISDHYTTKSSVLKQSNNKTQYLFQVVLITPTSPTITNNVINEPSQKIGNVRVLTRKVITTTYTKNALENLLMGISDYLVTPNDDITQTPQNENKECKTNKNNIRINESQIRSIVRETLRRYLQI